MACSERLFRAVTKCLALPVSIGFYAISSRRIAKLIRERVTPAVDCLGLHIAQHASVVMFRGIFARDERPQAFGAQVRPHRMGGAETLCLDAESRMHASLCSFKDNIQLKSGIAEAISIILFALLMH